MPSSVASSLNRGRSRRSGAARPARRAHHAVAQVQGGLSEPEQVGVDEDEVVGAALAETGGGVGVGEPDTDAHVLGERLMTRGLDAEGQAAGVVVRDRTAVMSGDPGSSPRPSRKVAPFVVGVFGEPLAVAASPAASTRADPTPLEARAMGVRAVLDHDEATPAGDGQDRIEIDREAM